MPLNAKSFKIFAIAAVSGLAAVTAAKAGDDVTFAYRSSELQSTASVSSLYNRLEARVENVCAANARAIYAKKAAQSCEDSLVNEWIDEIGDSRLNRHHAQNGASQVASARK